MKYYSSIVIILFYFFLLSNASAESSEQFLISIDDVPVIPEFKEITATGVNFETINGRIAQTQAVGPKHPDIVRAFYKNTLPQLGWRDIGANSFLREDEILHIQIKLESNNTTSIIFSLRPRSPN
jgi:hypothetical protein